MAKDARRTRRLSTWSAIEARPEVDLDRKVEAMAERMASAPINQLIMQKMLVNQAIEAAGIMNTQRLATIFDGISRHSPEGLNFKARVEEVGWKQAVAERDHGTFDWTSAREINDEGSW